MLLTRLYWLGEKYLFVFSMTKKKVSIYRDWNDLKLKMNK